ncbi:MAG TPA: DJ-1/PfpI family protein [Deltaproteobacteria bacterium]|nr:DJ-1/PfpI family protein [Candidatus Binatota bacterium]HIL13220.1 DJ-1/PfpI family protein [Deltaproteobacteria bacterium]
MFGNCPQLELCTVALSAGPVKSAQGVEAVADYALDDCPPLDLLLIPGGFGSREEISNQPLLDWLGKRVAETRVTMTVCSGSMLLAATGLLDGRPATTNKALFNEITEFTPAVKWVKQARWVDDGDIVTASGVSAGIDMALAVVAREFGEEQAKLLAELTEYEWHRDPNWDPFARVHGLVD